MPPHIVDYGRPLRAREARMRIMRSQTILWRELKEKPLGYTFDRDHPIDRYNVAFYCKALKLVVEVDGVISDDMRVLQRSDRRHARLGRLGVAVLRFTDDEVVHNIDGVVGTIRRWIRNRPVK